MPAPTISWSKDHIKLIDQTKLPNKFEYIHCRDLKSLWGAIKRLSVRGAPAIGVAAAFGVNLASQKFRGKDVQKFRAHVKDAAKYLATSRPTAVNLFHMLDRMLNVMEAASDDSVAQLKKELHLEAMTIYHEDQQVCRRMGAHGATLIKSGKSYLTVCNAGALATVDYGTALGVFYAANEKSKKFDVFACETRPLLQGARLTTWELLREKIPTTLICDSMAATLMKQGKIQGIFTGADRVAANGDSANKIGTYSLAVLAHHHKVPFYIVAPYSTFDFDAKTGKDIPIEERGWEEVGCFRGVATAPKKVKVYNPAFDVTEAKYITAIITEAGIVRSPDKKKIKNLFKNAHQA